MYIVNVFKLRMSDSGDIKWGGLNESLVKCTVDELRSICYSYGCVEQDVYAFINGAKTQSFEWMNWTVYIQVIKI